MSGARRHYLKCSSFNPDDIVKCRNCSLSYFAKEMPKTSTGFRFVCSRCSNKSLLQRYHNKKRLLTIARDEAVSAIKSVINRPDTIKNSIDENVIVSSDGLVSSINRDSVLKPQDWDCFKKGYKGIRGYYVFRNTYVHRIVAGAFFGESDMIVNHIDSNRLNNDLENLEYVSARENSVHATMNRSLKKAYRHNISNGRTWYSRINNDGTDEYLGSFFTKDEAEEAFNKRFLEIHKGSYYDNKYA